MNTFDALDFPQWKALLLYGLIAAAILFALLSPLLHKRLSKNSPYRGARSVDDVTARGIYSMGAKRTETPYLEYVTLHSTLGVRLGVAGLVAVMLWYAIGMPESGQSYDSIRQSDLFNWAIIGLAVYQLVWISRFYVKYDGTTLETIDWLHRRKTFKQEGLIMVLPRSNNQTYRLQYEKGHVSILMYIQDRNKFLQDMEAKIAENNARLL